MDDFKTKYIPVDKEPLCKDANGDPCYEEWDYIYVVGMLLYLAGSSRPDIIYTVHQCARFSHSPKCTHEIGVTYIIRYLKGTRKRGVVMKPDLSNLQLDLFADADFAGLYATKDKTDPISVKN